jgi:hypothetical protein
MQHWSRVWKLCFTHKDTFSSHSTAHHTLFPEIANIRAARLFVFLITKYVAIYALSYIHASHVFMLLFPNENTFQDFDTQKIRQENGGMRS